MARASRFKTDQTSSSIGHQKIGGLLKELLPLYKIYQEYPLDLVLKRGYRIHQIPEEFQDQFLLKRARGLRADWVVLDLDLVVEYHGDHHYHPVDYGDGRGEEAHQRRLHLDRVKRRIIGEAGFRLIEWPHFEKLTQQTLSNRIEEVFDNGQP